MAYAIHIFVSGVIENSSLVLHIGEIHLYFDFAKNCANPRYVNCSFYGNYQPFRVVIDSARLKQMTHILKSLLTSNDLLQLKFPISSHLFRNSNELHDKFVEQQKELMQQSMFNLQNQWIPNGKWFNINQMRRNRHRGGGSGRDSGRGRGRSGGGGSRGSDSDRAHDSASYR